VREGKPIFLSIGYSTCHWCHVMAHESFDNEEIAALLNRWFICIKVDREERPDVDQMYMAAVQALSGSGGWPMTVFLTPEGTPFYGGTYFPPESGYGRPGLVEVLQSIHIAWEERRGDILSNGAAILNHLRESALAGPATEVELTVLTRAYEELVAAFDPEYGGFGRAPKFPRPVAVDFLLRYFKRSGAVQAKEMVLLTLRRMADGGMYDHLGGGFHRYSVDEQWRVPHFEKMLYDQAQLAEAYLDGLQVSGDPFFGRIAREIFVYVLRDMTDAGGGFHSAEDADSIDPYHPATRSEGAFYLWKAEEIAAHLGAEQARLFNLCFGVETQGNALADPQKEFTGKNILYRALTDEAAAAQLRRPVEVVSEIVTAGRQKLFAKRSERPRPHCDDKVITAWNGLMIGGLARGAMILDDRELLQASIRAASFIRSRLYDEKSKTLLRRYRDNEAGLAAHLDDYAFLVQGLLELYQADQDPQWLAWAEDLTSSQIRLFQDDKGGFFYSVQDDTLPFRQKSEYDGAEPAGNSIAAMNLLRLAVLLDRQEFRLLAEQSIAAFSGTLTQHPTAMIRMLAAVDQLHRKPRQVVIAGRRGDAKTEEMLRTAYGFYQPDMIILLADNGPNQAFLAQRLPFMQGVTMIKETATAYVCENFTCQLPLTEVEKLREMLRQ
jgi:hypothetical protein